MVSGTDTKNHGELPTLIGTLTHEAQTTKKSSSF